MLTDGPNKVIGSGLSIISYLIHRPGNDKIKRKLYPPSHAALIEQEMLWYAATVKPVSEQLVSALTSGANLIPLE